MPLSLSSHLLEQYYNKRPPRAPFGQPFNAPRLTISGPMSYAPQMHGLFPIQQPFADQSVSSADASSFHSWMDMSESSAKKIAELQAKLDKKLGPEYISQRVGPGGSGGMKLTYAEGWKIINLANEVFGFNGWSSSVVNLNTDFVDWSEESRRWSVGVSAVVRVTLRDGVFHEDVGYGMLENSKSKGAALDKCKKEAVTDAVKRTLRNFGNLLGNCLYDKQYAQEIVKIKVPPPKFDKSALHRRPEFQEEGSLTTCSISNPPAPVFNASTSSIVGGKPTIAYGIPKALSVPPLINSVSNTGAGNTNKPPNAIPAHVQPNAMSTPIRKSAPPQGDLGGQKSVIGNAVQKAPEVTNASSNITAGPQGPIAQKAVPNLQQRPAANQPVMQLREDLNGQVVQMKKEEPEVQEAWDRDDMYDDDVLAALDISEGHTMINEYAADIGRPINETEGIGSAIDFDEGPHAAEETDGTSPNFQRTTLAGGIPPQKWRPVGTGITKSAFSNGASDRDVPLSKPRAVPVAPPHSGIMQPRKSSAPSVARAAPSISAEEEIANQIIALRQQRNTLRKQAASAGVADDENNRANAMHSVPVLQSINTNKPRTSAMGGFNFPPGMNPVPAPLPSRPNLGGGIQAGVKRPSDSMNTAPVSTNGAAVSYAIVQADAQTRAARQPLAPLAVLDGGDLKRIRR